MSAQLSAVNDLYTYNPVLNANTVYSCAEMIVFNSCSVQPTNLPDALYVLATQFIVYCIGVGVWGRGLGSGFGVGWFDFRIIWIMTIEKTFLYCFNVII